MKKKETEHEAPTLPSVMIPLTQLLPVDIYSPKVSELRWSTLSVRANTIDRVESYEVPEFYAYKPKPKLDLSHFDSGFAQPFFAHQYWRPTSDMLAVSRVYLDDGERIMVKESVDEVVRLIDSAKNRGA